jgi:hypothetical protein
MRFIPMRPGGSGNVYASNHAMAFIDWRFEEFFVPQGLCA